MATFKATILKGVNDTKEDGTTNVKIRITHNRKVNYISTDLFIIPDQMDIKAGQVVKGANIAFINLSITSWMLKCQKMDVELGDKKLLMSVSDIKNHILNIDKKVEQLDFFKFADKLISDTNREGTATNYLSCARRIKSFAGPVLPFSEINLAFLNRFEAFLYNQGVRNAIVNYMFTFRSIFNKARITFNDDEIGLFPIPHYPFQRYKMPKRKPHAKEHVLTVEEFTSFLKYEPKNKGEEYTKDMFLLMFYMIGIEAKDLTYLPKAINGRIVYDRFKTGRLYSIKIEPEAQRIIDKYPGKHLLLNISEKYNCSQSFYAKLNNNLHGSDSRKFTGIFKALKINKEVTTKWARHTWATFARNDCRINKDDVALCLGHADTDNQVTDMYVKYDYSIIDECNKQVLAFIKAESV